MSPEALRAVMAAWIAEGLDLSLHESDPGDAGAGEIAGLERIFIAASDLRIEPSRLILSTAPDAVAAAASGEATHFGLWFPSGEYLAGGALIEPVSIVTGGAITIAVDSILLEFARG